ncbi:discoidin domain-containing protein [Actinopolymorpha cephalotaxi]|uniref:F5/8 type C domain-containing protein n=1 Tax=Actinopolymorpha cephalotaxi TaxID=504797 RepID=A0ABX2S3S5_9ACTN|nr:discoidin domain-containing protein [Actinopolymorpha cephalotaxi]NYH84278.1 hypothetical protein [Actinopolymorpha cephalotaxi]
MCALVVAASTASVAAADRTDRAEKVASVDGHPVSRDELLFHMRRLAPAVQNELHHKYHLKGTVDWDARVGDRSALERLTSRALEEIRRERATILLADRYGLDVPVGYQAFQAELAAENHRRAEAAATGRPVHGPRRFTAEEYYSHRLTEVRTALKKRLAAKPGGPLGVSDADVRHAYDADRRAWSANATTYRYTRLVVAVPKGASAEATARLKREVTTSGHLADSAGKLRGAELTTGTFHGRSAGPSAHDQELAGVLGRLAPGRISAPVTGANQLTFYELRSRTVDEKAALKAYSPRIRQSLVDRKFAALLRQQEKNTKVEADNTAIAAVDKPALTAAADRADTSGGQRNWPGNSPNRTGGTDYFLDATHGSDTATGTSPTTAWRSLATANAKTFRPGDRILLRAGEQWNDEQLWPKGSGSTGKPITISAYGDPEAGRPYIATNGNVPSPLRADGTKNPQTVGLTGAIVLRNQQYYEINNVELSNDDDFATDITEGAYVRDGIMVSINADLLPAGADSIMDHFRISDVYVHNLDGPSYWQRIHYGAVNFQVFGARSYKDYAPGGYHFKDVRIENNTFENVELHAIQFAFNWFAADGADAGQYDENGKFHEGWEQLWVRTRDLYSRDVYIGHNYAESIGQGAIQLANTKNMTVEYNEVNGFLERYGSVSVALYLWAGADSVMQYNEVYGGPHNEFDGTPWDLEYTNFNVTYQFNYSHDNPAGWMSYMGNSSNSVARYNLSVNDNGVLVKNMLSTNYSPTYFANNTFVYDGADLDYFHDETFLSTVYFLNNVFYNSSKSTQTPWYRRTGALRHAVFSHNDYYEASGTHSAQEPADPSGLRADPMFVGRPDDYVTGAGVERIRQAAAHFRLRSGSPLVDAGRYNPHLGTQDFLGTHVYYGDAPDIGIAESRVGERVDNPVDHDPIEDEPGDGRTNLALGRPVEASSTHPGGNGTLVAANLTDGDDTTRWAAADDAAYPITLDIDLGADTTFDEVYLDEYTDAGTNPRVRTYELQRWDAGAGTWVTFASRDDGIGHDRTVSGFGSVTTSRLRVALTGRISTEVYTPTMTEIAVYRTGG